MTFFFLVGIRERSVLIVHCLMADHGMRPPKEIQTVGDRNPFGVLLSLRTQYRVGKCLVQ